MTSGELALFMRVINKNARTSRALHYLDVTSTYFNAASVISVV